MRKSGSSVGILAALALGLLVAGAPPCTSAEPGSEEPSSAKPASAERDSAGRAAAGPEGRIEKVRLGSHPGYVRIVFEVEPNTGAYLTERPRELHIAARPPVLDPVTRRRMRELGLALERSDAGARMRLDRASAGGWSAFRLGDDGSRIVVDLGDRVPELPADAERVPERRLETARRPDPSAGADRSAAPSVRARVTGIRFAGILAEGPTAEELLDLELSVRPTQGGAWELADASGGARAMRLRDLAGVQPGGSMLTASVLQQIVESVAAAYSRYGLVGTRVDIRRSDLDAVAGSPGTLVIHVSGARTETQ